MFGFLSKRRTDPPLSLELGAVLDAIKILDKAKDRVACSEWHIRVIGEYWLHRAYKRLLDARTTYFNAPGPGR